MKSPVTVITILLVLLAASLGYIVGKQGFVINNPLESQVPVASLGPSTSKPEGVACTMDAKVCDDGSSVGRVPPTCEFAPCPSIKPKTQSVEAGGILNFPKYKLTIPSDWVYTKDSQTKDDQKLTLSKGDLKITIQQGGFGGAMCLYPGDAGGEGPSGRYTSYVEIQTQSGDLLRRSTPENGKGFGICELSKYGWGAPTKYGHISLTIPDGNSAENLNLIDSILASITKLSQ